MYGVTVRVINGRYWTKAQERAADRARHCHSANQGEYRITGCKTFEAKESFLAIVSLWTDGRENGREMEEGLHGS